MMRPIACVVLVLALLTGWNGAALGHGSWAHVHVTGWAIRDLPPGGLRDFFDDPAVFNAAIFAAAFTDSGYVGLGSDAQAAHAYGEHTHWEPFVRDAVAWIRENDPPPWDTIESRKRAAFIMGCAAHGQQDEIFDSLFLYQVDRYDAGGQDKADPAVDGFLQLDGLFEFFPSVYLPMDMLLDLYSGLSHPVTADVIEEAVGYLTGVYINDELGPLIAESLGKDHEADLPWTRKHYLDPGIPGSLGSEVPATARYLEAIWARFHGQFQPNDAVVHTFPAPDQGLLGVDAATPDSWVTLIYGAGVRNDSLEAAWTTASDTPVGFTLHGTRWGGTWPRLHRLQPESSLDPGNWYTVEASPGLEFIDGSITDVPFTLRFQAPCSNPEDEACLDVPDEAEPVFPVLSGGCSTGRPANVVWPVAFFLLALIFRSSRLSGGTRR